jgi:ribosomal protein S18 acetylase RimI-like enzyme
MVPGITDLLIRPLRVTDAASLGDLFEEIAADAESVCYFHPHPLTREYAALLCGGAATRRDRYSLGLYHGLPVAYALLRGWDEGYAIPSWGGCVHPALRGAGLGHALLLHAVAESRAAGAAKLRLTVYKANERGVRLYSRFGFVLQEKDARSLLGVLDLTACFSWEERRPDGARLQAWYEARRTRAAA